MEKHNMNLPIYQQEIRDGLQDAIANSSVACVAIAEVDAKPSPEAVEKLQKIMAGNKSGGELSVAENKEQIDLFYLKSILVSTGWNKNDDVFDRKELWDARNTPEDKPFNFMHNEKDIIGHITANEVVDFEGNRIESDSDIPNEFNILTSAVIYTEWSDPEQRQRMQKIIAEIEDNKWFVSMECLFPNFDYALKSSKGEMRVVRRDEASAFLTKHLRSYGGTGIYEDYQVGRLLRNLSFSGKGLVSKPANPRSVILEGNDFFDESQAKVLTLSSLKEKNMSDSFKEQVLRAELVEAKAANEALKEKVVAEQRAEYEEKIQALEATIAEQSAKITEQASAHEDLSTSLTEAQEALAAKEKDMKEKMEELKEMKKKEAMMKRKAQLEEVGVDAEEASATLSEFEDVDDATFDKVIAAMKKVADMHGDKEKDKEKEKEKAAKEKAAMDKEKALKEKASEQASDEVDSAEASEEVLDGVVAPSEVAIAEAMGEEDPSENLRAVATEWIGSVLKHNNS
jgi:myosin heavy subunit